MDWRIKPSGLLAPDYELHFAPARLIRSKQKSIAENICWFTVIYYDYLLTKPLETRIKRALDTL